MNVIRRGVIAIIVFLFLYAAWYGAEMLIHGESQRSIVDALVAIAISLSISGNVEKGVEEHERAKELAGNVFRELSKEIQKREEAEDGKNGNRERNA